MVKTPAKYLAFLNSSEKKRLYGVFALILLGALCESASLALVLPYMDFLQTTTAAENILFIPALLATLALLGVLLGRMFMQLFVSRVITNFAYAVGENHSKRLFKRYLSMDYQKFIHKSSTTLVKNCTHTMDQAAQGLLLFLQFASAACVVIGLTIVLLIDNAYATLMIATSLICIGIPIYKYFKHKQRTAGKDRDVILGHLCKLTTEAFQCFKEIHLYDKRPYFTGRFADKAKQLKKANADSTFYPLLPGPCIEAMALAGLLGVVLWFVWNNLSLQQLVPQLIFYGVIGRRLLPSLHQSIYFGMALQKLQPCMELVHDEYAQTEERIDPIATPSSFRKGLTFHQISFAYEAARPTLQEISFTLQRNQSVALVGPSGAGKSTAVEILSSLLQPDQGHFIVDGQIASDLSSLRHQIGYVPQRVNLIDDTLENNIAFGEETIDTTRLHKAIEMAHLKEFLSQLPQGLQTTIGERGVKLSGGQRQRVGIARALYFDPKIIIFDEATASLDTISEQIITENIQEIAGKKTILAIAHRISTIKNFDKIYVFREGCVISSGTHQQLLNTCPLYQAMNND